MATVKAVKVRNVIIGSRMYSYVENMMSVVCYVRRIAELPNSLEHRPPPAVSNEFTLCNSDYLGHSEIFF